VTIGIANRESRRLRLDSGGGVESVAFTFTKVDYHTYEREIHKELWYSS